MIWNIVAISALGVLSSKYFHSKVQNIAVAKTRVGAFLSHLWKQFAAGSGNMFFLQYLTTSCHPDSVATVVGAVVVLTAAMRYQVAILTGLLVGQLQRVSRSFVLE